MKTIFTIVSLLHLAIMFTILLSFSSEHAFAQQGQRWWQRETPTPSQNQIINPSYLQKKRELEVTWDLYQNQIRAEAHFRSLGQNTRVLRRGIRELELKIARLEHKLTLIPMYLER